MPEAVIYAVDDDARFLQAMLRSLHSIGVPVHGFCDGADLLKALDHDVAGCVITDLRMPGMDGLALQDRLQGCGLPVIFVTGHGETRDAVAALKGGALDFLEKPFGEATLLSTVRLALDRDAERRRQHAKRAELRARVDTLSPREQEVFRLIVADLPNKVIARRLGISPRTVEHHREHLMLKLHTRSFGELMRLGIRLGICVMGNPP